MTNIEYAEQQLTAVARELHPDATSYEPLSSALETIQALTNGPRAEMAVVVAHRGDPVKDDRYLYMPVYRDDSAETIASRIAEADWTHAT